MQAENHASLNFTTMYTRQQASQIRQQFWTRFGQYMHPVKSATGETVNWLNYKTGIRHIFFRMDAGRERASIAIELGHSNEAERMEYFEKLQQYKKIIEEYLPEKWTWESTVRDEDDRMISRIGTSIHSVNIFREADWPRIISFLKPRILALDACWAAIKDGLA